jgi:hypothetical protein
MLTGSFWSPRRAVAAQAVESLSWSKVAADGAGRGRAGAASALTGGLRGAAGLPHTLPIPAAFFTASPPASTSAALSGIILCEFQRLCAGDCAVRARCGAVTGVLSANGAAVTRTSLRGGRATWFDLVLLTQQTGTRSFQNPTERRGAETVRGITPRAAARCDVRVPRRWLPRPRLRRAMRPEPPTGSN